MAELSQDIDAALHRLEQAKMLAIPTETVYGLAADASSEQAIQAIYALKNRPIDKTLALNVHPDWPIEQWVEDVPQIAQKLIAAFWPGPLSIILQAKKDLFLPYLLNPDHRIALRCPNHPMTLELLKRFNKPIVAPSANPSQELSANKALQVLSYFKDQDLLILDGGPTALGLESTIVNIHHDHYEILRYGAISQEALKACLGFKASAQPKALHKSSSLNIPMYFFTNPINLTHDIHHALYILDETCAQAYPKLNSIRYKPQNFRHDFYQLLQEAQHSDARVILLQVPEHCDEGIKARIEEFSKPLSSFFKS